MVYQSTNSGLSGVRGSHYTQGLDFLYFARNGADAGVWRMPINPARVIASALAQQATTTSASINLNTGTIGGAVVTQRNLRWVSNTLRPVSAARLRRWTDSGTFDEITATQLANLAWDPLTPDVATSTGAVTSWPEHGDSTEGHLYAVRFVANGAFRYAKVRVYFDGATRFDWTTYSIDQAAVSVCDLDSTSDLRDVILANYETEMYISGSVGGLMGIHRFVNLNATSSSAPFFTSKLDGYYYALESDQPINPQQMALDGGFVYFVADGHVWRQDLISVSPERIVDLPAGVNGIGLLLEATSGGVWAYIADDQGYIRVVNLSGLSTTSGALVAPANGEDGAFLVPRPEGFTDLVCGFLSWGNAEHTNILVTDRTHQRILRFSLSDGSFRVAEPVVPSPWSTEAISPDRFYVTSDAEIGRVDDTILVAGGNRILGIGLIPFQFINHSVDNPNPVLAGSNAGRADTSTETGYYFSQYPNLPFGGNLSLQLNIEGMREDQIHSYSVSIQKRPAEGEPTLSPRAITTPFTNLRWDDALSRWVSYQRPLNPLGRYLVPDTDELRYNPYLAAIIATNESDSGYNEILVTFYDAEGGVIPQPGGDTGRRLIYIDNRRYHTSLQLPRVSTTDTEAPGPAPSVLECGCLGYTNADKNDRVAVDFSAWQATAPGIYTLNFYRGGAYLPELQQTGEVDEMPVPRSKFEVTPGTPLRVGHLMGDCDVANIRIRLTVSSRVIDGFGWVDLSSYSDMSFTMLPLESRTHTDWTAP